MNAAVTETPEYGAVFALVMYVFQFMESVMLLPLFYQQWLRLREISGRLARAVGRNGWPRWRRSRSWTITNRRLPLGTWHDAKNGMRPVHPGEILREELDDLGLSANALSKALGVPVNRVTMILNGQRGVTADTALRLARYFGTTPQLC